MQNYTYLDLFKRRAKQLSKRENLKLAAAHEQLARSCGFNDYHECQTVAKRWPNDPRLVKAGLGVPSPSDVLYESSVYSAVEEQIEEELSEDIATTNASNFTMENLEILESGYCQSSGICSIRICGEYTGEQNPNRVYHDHAFPFHAHIRARTTSTKWELAHEEGFTMLGICHDCQTVEDLHTVLDEDSDPTSKEICNRCLESSEDFGECFLCHGVFSIDDLHQTPGGNLACPEHIDEFTLDEDEEEGWRHNIEKWNDDL